MDITPPEERKLKYSDLLPRVREVLTREWDPIGVSKMPDGPPDDYDRHAEWLCGRLFDPAFTEAEVALYLAQVAEKWMGLPPNGEATKRAALAVIALKREFFGSPP
jgi:hypothetical protein